MKVGILGWGAIGSWVGEKLYNGSIPGVTLEAVASRNYRLPAPVKCIEPLELSQYVDVVIETAGHEAVNDYVPGLLKKGIRVVLVSTGALRDQGLYDELAKAGGDRLILSTGAIGGIDIVRACRQAGNIESITLSTTKPSLALERPWMSAEMIAQIREGREVVECYRGSALAATELFPESVNVAATLAFAAGSWKPVDVRIFADPLATLNSHKIDIVSDIGLYKVEVSNHPLPSNPKSSALVGASLLRSLHDLTTNLPTFM